MSLFPIHVRCVGFDMTDEVERLLRSKLANIHTQFGIAVCNALVGRRCALYRPGREHWIELSVRCIGDGFDIVTVVAANEQLEQAISDAVHRLGERLKLHISSGNPIPCHISRVGADQISVKTDDGEHVHLEVVEVDAPHLKSLNPGDRVWWHPSRAAGSGLLVEVTPHRFRRFKFHRVQPRSSYSASTPPPVGPGLKGWIVDAAQQRPPHAENGEARAAGQWRDA